MRISLLKSENLLPDVQSGLQFVSGAISVTNSHIAYFEPQLSMARYIGTT